MQTIKDISNFYNTAIFYDYKIKGIIEEIIQLRKCIINSFLKQI